MVWLESGCGATLVHPRLLVYAGHCGEEHERAWLGSALDVEMDPDSGIVALREPSRYRHVDIKRCRVYPDSAIGRGNDFAYCELTEPLRDVAAIPPSVGCERASVQPGTEVTILGFGFASLEDDTPGIKRVARTEVVRMGREIVIGDMEIGTCRGDSSGPAFIDVSEPGASEPDWRMLGLLSSGIVGECGVGWYTDISKMVTWLESDSGYDVTPCFDDQGRWRPGPSCQAPGLDRAGEPLATTGARSKSCGAPYSAGCGVYVRTGPETSGAWWLSLMLVVLLLWHCRKHDRAHLPRSMFGAWLPLLLRRAMGKSREG
ncbi:MAG: trypsin-like serine protease [Anaerolineae bacterium]|nr:trypsin-like serine protease [Anaerolineae bacterium]